MKKSTSIEPLSEEVKFLTSSILGNQLHCSDEVVDYIYCQMILESDNFTSNITLENNNFIGMKLPHLRPTTAIDVNRGYAVYRDTKQCITDYSLWLCYNRFTYIELRDLEKFKNKIKKCKYSETPDYIERITKIYINTLNNY